VPVTCATCGQEVFRNQERLGDVTVCRVCSREAPLKGALRATLGYLAVFLCLVLFFVIAGIVFGVLPKWFSDVVWPVIVWSGGILLIARAWASWLRDRKQTTQTPTSAPSETDGPDLRDEANQ